ncbi:MAG: cutC copper transporter [Benniella sp.]|nr:MAG: cutC copper transporter [Benniella sp.]
MAPVFEVCLDSVASAIIAEKNGSKRIELCAGLMEGGITPSAGLIATVKAKTSLPVMVMIRPRGGDFCYDDDEFEGMLQDIKLCHSLNVDGVVIGVLLPDGSVDKARVKRLVDAAQPMLVTFHRAFDMVKDPFQALEDIIEIGGIQRILTSGCERSAYEGLDMLVELSKRADGRIIIMPGAGITDRNVNKIVSAMNATEVHVGAGGTQESKMEFRNPYCSMGYAISAPEYSLRITSGSRLGAMIQKF